MTRHADTISQLQQTLKKAGNPKTKDWWERYMKGVTPFYGTPMENIRRELNNWLTNTLLLNTPEEDHPALLKKTGLALFEGKHAEDKLAGTLLFSEHLIPQGHMVWEEDIPKFADLYDRELIKDWNICDWFCGKVIKRVIIPAGESCAREVISWREASALWRRRASIVAFVRISRQGDDFFPGLVNLLFETADMLLVSDERFIQTGVCWTLRNLALAEPDKVEQFLADNFARLTTEGIRSAIKSMEKDRADSLLAAFKSLPRGAHR